MFYFIYMNKLNSKIKCHMKNTILCSLISSLFAACFCCMIGLFYLIPFLTLIFIVCWIIGGITAFIFQNESKQLIKNSCMWNIALFVPLSIIIVFSSFYGRYILESSILICFSIGIYSACSYGAMIVFMSRISRN